MYFKYFAFTIVLFAIASFSLSAQEKKSLQVDDFDHWNHLSNEKISPNGMFVAYEINPYKGDGVLKIWEASSGEKTTFQRGGNPKFAPNSAFLAFSIKPQHDSVRKMKLDGVKKDKLPKDSLGIYLTESEKLKKYARVKSFKIPEDDGDWIAWQNEKPLKDKTKKDSTVADSAREKTKKKKQKADKNAPDAYELVVYNPVEDITHRFKNVTEYAFFDNGRLLTFIKQQNDTVLRSAVVTFDTRKRHVDTVFVADGLAKKVEPGIDEQHVAFIHSADTIKARVYSLHYWNGKETIGLVDTLSTEIPEGWTVSEHGRIYFSDNDERLFFGIADAPEPKPKDTLLDEEKVNLDLWSWTDGKLQPEQLKEKKREENRNYLTVYHISEEKLVQLEDEKLQNVRLTLDGNGDVAYGADYEPYEKRGSWEMPYYKDVYVVDVITGQKIKVLEEIQSATSISFSGKYINYYNNNDSAWHVYDIQDKKDRNLTGNLDVPFYRVTHDYPNEPSPYYYAGWTKDDDWFLVYDEFDIWQIDPSGRKDPVCLTNEYGRKNNIRFRYRQLDRDAKYIDPKSDLWLTAFDQKTKASGYYITSLGGGENPEKLIMDDYRFYAPRKAKNADKLIWQKASFKDYPDVWYSDMKISEPVKISNTNPQQNKYKWGSVELVKWITSEGTEEEGLLYKPENFDPNKKYPMMVYFYRLYSDRLHAHWTPKPSRSIINTTFYTSNDYIVFIPNIRYKVGYPGESAYNYVSSGTVALLNKYDFIDKDHIGIQGQSWGGYEAAYIITKTDMFAAASAGAPVSNMTSAYGGIRWGSGMSRMFQYEETQSRIGGTLWEKPLHYIENSPVFYAPKVHTPLLMRHNDGDGAVPWYQGIEYFVALRRLNKPVWLLNYNDGAHNERGKTPNRKDLSIRMKQFFDHYLKEEPAPKWMREGIPAVEKGKTMGYELE